EYYHHLRNYATDSESQRFLAVLFKALVRKIESLKPSALLSLANGIHGAIADQTLLMYDRRPAVESAISAVGAAGWILNPPNDSLFVVDHNMSYNKINPYIDEQATYNVWIARDLSAAATLSITYHDRPSPVTIYGDGPYYEGGHTKHDYQDFVRVYVPAGARLVSSNGLEFWAPTQAYGLTQLAGRILVTEGHTHVVTFRYRLPSWIFARSGPNRYVLTVERQPGGDLKHVTLVVHAASGLSVGKPGTGEQTVTFPLKRTANHVAVRLLGATATPPPAPFRDIGTPDPYIPATDFRWDHQVF
ncbi:MAG TPA: hypothetical protein VG815_05675, partial [Chloroflexota bacterium]|nr:hypothetical protein [Chloroflexota bacterium]